MRGPTDRTVKTNRPTDSTDEQQEQQQKEKKAAERVPASPYTSLPLREEMMAKYTNFSLESHNISLTEQSKVAVEKNITLEKPTNVELTCQFTTSGDLNSVNVTWRKGDKLLENNYLVNASGTILYTQYMFTIFSSEQMGSYTCFFGEEKEHRGTFNFKVPELIGKYKPMITYVGDSTILKCKCQDCFPLNWTWYSSNGSVQVPIDVHMNDKYVVNGTNANETRLKIMQLSEEDQGSYWCHAIFQLGKSEGRFELVVLSYLVPLKPFLAIAAEVVLLVTIILLCEVYTKKKKTRADDGKEFEQIEQLKSDDSNGIENNATRHRKNILSTVFRSPRQKATHLRWRHPAKRAWGMRQPEAVGQHPTKSVSPRRSQARPLRCCCSSLQQQSEGSGSDKTGGSLSVTTELFGFSL
ncbi:Embigin [Galemys pyrenaicus]|uniref:Embigin n=1 Tax=Galemys pyrenaicus TaxID=202257 RepID=A0A8J6A1S6_GALPY|nr:Embigin [Galemys pyrenaicus]